MDKSRLLISFDNAKCSGCSELVCVGVCPQGLIETERDSKVYISDVSSCTLCGVCAHLCPAKAINIKSSTTRKETSR